MCAVGHHSIMAEEGIQAAKSRGDALQDIMALLAVII